MCYYIQPNEGVNFSMVKNYMLELGFTLKETEKILNASPVDKYIKETLYRKVKSYFECLLELGFEKDIIKNIAVKNPHVFCYNMGSLSLKINNLVSGYFKYFRKFLYSSRVRFFALTHMALLCISQLKRLLPKVSAASSQTCLL